MQLQLKLLLCQNVKEPQRLFALWQSLTLIICCVSLAFQLQFRHETHNLTKIKRHNCSLSCTSFIHYYYYIN